jgi:hypothetical protein
MDDETEPTRYRRKILQQEVDYGRERRSAIFTSSMPRCGGTTIAVTVTALIAIWLPLAEFAP